MINSRQLSFSYAEVLEEPLTPSHEIFCRRVQSIPHMFTENEADPYYSIKLERLSCKFFNLICSHSQFHIPGFKTHTGLMLHQTPVAFWCMLLNK